MYTYVLIIQIMAIITTFVIITVLMCQKCFEHHSLLVLLMTAIMVLCIGYLLVITSKTKESALTAVKIQYVGSCYISLLFLVFLMDYCNVKKPMKLIIADFAINTGILLAVFTCDYHPLYYSSIDFVETGLFPHLILEKGPIYHFFKIQVFFYNVIILFLLINHYVRQKKEAKGHQMTIIFAILVPCMASLLYALGFYDIYDPSSASFAISGVIILISIHNHHIFDVIHSAKDSVIGCMDEALVVVDDRFCFLDMNPAAVRLFPELKHIHNGVEIENYSPLLQMLLTTNTSNTFSRNEHFYSARTSKVLNDNKKLVGYFIWIFDITESHNSIENLRTLKHQAEKASEAKSTFLASMSHEIRTPMNAMLGLTDLILLDDIPDTVRDNVIRIKRAGTSLLGIINDILDFSKIESGKMTFVKEPYQFSSVIHDVVSIISVKLSQKPIKLNLNIAPDIPKFLIGDETRFRQILINILNNAVKFTDSGSINLIAEWEMADNKALLHFTITDTGRGIYPEDVNRIFNSFEQGTNGAVNYVEGTGLGLTICKKILDELGGTITVESLPYQGSTFRFTLPQEIHEKPLLSQNRDSKESLPVSFTAPSASVLIVDDNLLNLKVAGGLLSIFQMKITLAESGKECLDLLKKQHFDLIFLDYMMPEMDGTQTLMKIRDMEGEYYQNVPIIVLTANAISGARERFLRDGFHDYISKPISLSLLSELLYRWLPKDKIHRKDSNKKTVSQAAISQQWQEETVLSPNYHINDAVMIDYETGIKNCAGLLSCYLEAIELFCQESTQKIVKLTSLLENKNYADYQIEVHGLKSSARTLGIPALADKAYELELACQSNYYDYLHKEMSALITLYEHSVNAFLSYLNTREHTTGTD
ncbi:MAG: response regulator [Lachnospiraceae bacterium]|nr:response regulator [Lachnospiraceae bacterium]